MGHDLRSQFLLDPRIAYLNHGAFGACARPVFERYQVWQRELETQPTEFMGRRFGDLMHAARQRLAAFLGVSPDHVIFLPNATTGMNLVARSLALAPGDQVLSTDHEYGAVDRLWRFVCAQRGATTLNRPIGVPLHSPEQMVNLFWEGVTERTRVISISHVTSPTALIFPVQDICRRARAAGLLSVVDGAHAPGQIPLDVEAIDADFYIGTCHKWMCAPKGAGFLYARPEVQALLQPLIVSWGWDEPELGLPPAAIATGLHVGGAQRFVRHHEWQGTRDISAYLSVAAAIDFMQANDWLRVQATCHALAADARARLLGLTGLPPFSPDSPEWYAQMVAVSLPACDVEEVKRRLIREYQVEVPVSLWNGSPVLRVSVAAYNTTDDIDRLLAALPNVVRM